MKRFLGRLASFAQLHLISVSHEFLFLKKSRNGLNGCTLRKHAYSNTLYLEIFTTIEGKFSEKKI